MKVVLIGNYVPDRQESMQRFAGLLYREISARGVAVEWLTPPVLFGRLPIPHRRLRQGLGFIDKFIIFPVLLRRRARTLRGSPVVYHICDHSNSPYFNAVRQEPHLITCNDLIAVRTALGEFPGLRRRWTGRLMQRAVLAGLGRARRIACISNATCSDLVRLLPHQARHACVVPMDLNYPYAPLPAAELQACLRRLSARLASPQHPAVDLTQESYLFHLGCDAWYKNRPGVIAIYHALVSRAPSAAPRWLLFAGQPWDAELEQAIAARQLSGRVLFLPSPTNEELRALYSGAQALLFPSLAEGFGWPIIEAQACGCPVITTDAPPMNEICGDGAVTVDPREPEAAATAIAALLTLPPAARADLIAKGFANARQYAQSRMAAAYLRLYEECLASNER